MNRDEFIKKQISKFGCFNENNMAIWKRDYEQALQEPDIDYEQLDLRIICEWDSTFNAPSTKWLMGAKKDCIPKDDRCQAVKDIHEMRKQSANQSIEDIAHIDEIRERMRKTLNKMRG